MLVLVVYGLVSTLVLAAQVFLLDDSESNLIPMERGEEEMVVVNKSSVIESDGSCCFEIETSVSADIRFT